MASQQVQRQQSRVEEGVELPIRGDHWREVFNKVIKQIILVHVFK